MDILDSRKQIELQLKTLSYELIVKAQLTILNKTNDNWLNEANTLYLEAIDTYKSKYNYKAYAEFLKYNGSVEKANEYYKIATVISKE